MPNQDKVRKDFHLLNRGSAKDGWSAGGTIKNPLGHFATYDITAFFTSSAATDLAYGSTSVKVGAGQSKPSVTVNFAPRAEVLCALRGVATR